MPIYAIRFIVADAATLFTIYDTVTRLFFRRYAIAMLAATPCLTTLYDISLIAAAAIDIITPCR